MIMRDVVDRLIDDFHERDLPELTLRENKAQPVAGKACVVAGMRRAGKTWFCYQKMKEILAGGTAKECIVYINFEDDRLLPFTVADFQEILDTYYRKFPALKNKKCYFFLDEVHNVDGWEKFVRRLLDTENLDVWLTGSSSKLLGSEIATSLRGRSLTTEIFPFSFAEFILFHKEELPTSSQIGSKQRARLQHLAQRYLEIGGFPEIQQMDESTRRQVHRNYVDVVILRDVVERYGVSNTVALRYLIRHTVASPASRFSVNRFYNALKSQAITCTKNDLYRFLGYLEDAFLLYPVEIFTRSEKARQVNPRKIYLIDPGLIESMSFKMTEDRGALLENLVFVHLRRQGIRPAYYVTKSGQEVDFVFRSAQDKSLQLIQVCWTLQSAQTRQRELSALRAAMNEVGAEKATLVTWLDDMQLAEDVETIPAWRWLLGREAIG
jgi:predicted AAA+ superfamily ATPase